MARYNSVMTSATQIETGKPAIQNNGSQESAEELKRILDAVSSIEQIELSQDEIDGIVKQLSRVMPAGDIPGVIASGMARLRERHILGESVDKDINWLAGKLKPIIDKATYLGVFAGPASAIWVYQNLLELAGKSSEDAFPDGLWQFYCEYALREDTARHSNESCGFDTILNAHDIYLDQVDRVSAWIMAAVHNLHQYDDLLENEWRERIYTHLMSEVTADLPDAARYARIYRAWRSHLPYHRDLDAGFDETYPEYRRRKFDNFFNDATKKVPAKYRAVWRERVRELEESDLPRYQRQMTILAQLIPGPYREERRLIELKKAQIAVIYQGVYYLLPVCQADGSPIDVDTVRGMVAAIFATPVKGNPFQLTYFPGMQRSSLAEFLKKTKNPDIRKLSILESVPIMINFDSRDPNVGLSGLRRAERGIGSHPLTLIDTGKTMVFDQSHIFFDGAWGAAFAEIVTNEATSWGVYLYTLPTAEPASTLPYTLDISLTDDDLKLIQKLPRVEHEAWAESSAIKIKAILALRKMFKRRSDLIQLTVNDLLVLYRGIHTALYQPSNELLDELSGYILKLAGEKTALDAMQALKQSWETQRINPSILIPVDASEQSPRERVHPLGFEVPLSDLNLLDLHRKVVSALNEYWNCTGDRHEAYQEFDHLQREYLTTIAAFGGVFNKAKAIAANGESASLGTLRLLAHLPTPVQYWLDNISTQINVLNDLIKGNEVFSNVGAVVPTSTLTRFLSAKDDNEKKNLVWGVLTDAEGGMKVTLRDFRPHVHLFIETGFQDVANMITQDYLNSFAEGLNQFVTDLRRITVASRETRLAFIRDIRELNQAGKSDD
ncbi:MAG TPA: hypothetical protein DEH25_02225 [Chloroflexi bacterium]|nr:hypothetical protein [Chloroflexota bacterium]HBY08841.1 hypothetical protein [Chloroflexota bacterium]